MRTFRPLTGVAFLTAALGWTVLGCSAGGESSDFGNGGSGSSGSSDGGVDGSMFGCNTCVGNELQVCDEHGTQTGTVDCSPQVCSPGLGCTPCIPGGTTCVGNAVHECTTDGQPGDMITECDVGIGEICGNGKCDTECDVMAGSPSNVGCEFWAVDLPNTRGVDLAADKPWGVVLTNAGQTVANVTIEINTAPTGEPLALETVATASILPGTLAQVELPMREVTGFFVGQPDPPGPTMSHLSSNAFRITSSTPLIAYQFNVFTNSFSNDASLLMPRNGLGKIYRALGFPTANPKEIEMPGVNLPGIPDHNCVTIVGVSPGTTVSVKVAHDIMGDGASIPPAKAGDTVSAVLGPFDVFNLCNYCEKIICTGDMSGTIVDASQPVAVFTTGERIIAPFSSDFPQPPNYSGDNCCTDHLEEQLFPVTALGKQLVVPHSPKRGTSYVEPDIIRFMGVASPSHVTTNMPPPWNEFDIQPGQMIETWTDKDLIVEMTEPVVVGQILVSQGYTQNMIGDPALTFFPSIEQFRRDYVFLIPPSWTLNYFVLATEAGNDFTFDDGAMPSGCTTTTIGQVAGKTYESVVCTIPEGAHKVAGAKDFGITLYGYGPAGSYAYSGGANVKEIYDPPPLK